MNTKYFYPSAVIVTLMTVIFSIMALTHTKLSKYVGKGAVKAINYILIILGVYVLYCLYQAKKNKELQKQKESYCY